MFESTLPSLRCPRRGPRASAPICGSRLQLEVSQAVTGASSRGAPEVRSGSLVCEKCRSRFPILAGIAVLVPDVRSYLQDHVKGIARFVTDAEIPAEHRKSYLAAKSQIQTEHIEEDLEAERVTALYLMNHYLPALGGDWWKAGGRPPSPLIEALVREHWDRGPFDQIGHWLRELRHASPGGVDKSNPPPSTAAGRLGRAIELGCGVGGLYLKIRSDVDSYLGVDGSFASIALARHAALGMPYPQPLRVPADLLQGSVSRKITLPPVAAPDGHADFVVGDLDAVPVARAAWDLSFALNAIDMLVKPETLPREQADLLRTGGYAIQSGPYVWHEQVARELRSRLPKRIVDSDRAVEWLYEQAGFSIERRIEHWPWLFFKHLRQLEIYSVHLILARKA